MIFTFRHGSMLAILLALAGCSGQATHIAPAAGATAAPSLGIAACDGYLSSYLACHRAAGIFPADTLEQHYLNMRDSLLQQAADPRLRPLLAGRCKLLATQLRSALRGASCGA